MQSPLFWTIFELFRYRCLDEFLILFQTKQWPPDE